MLGIEPGIDTLQAGEALDQQPGAGEQRERERHLGHDERPAEALAAPVAGAAPRRPP